MPYRRKKASPKRKSVSRKRSSSKKKAPRGRPIKDPYAGMKRLFKTPKKTKSKKAKRKSPKRKRTRSRSMSYRSPLSMHSRVTLSPGMADMLSVPMQYRSPGGRARLSPRMRQKLEEEQLRKEVSRLQKGQLAGMKGFGKLSKKQKSDLAKAQAISRHYTPRLQILQQEIMLLRNELQHLKQQMTKRKSGARKSKSPVKPRRIAPQPVPRRIVPQLIRP